VHIIVLLLLYDFRALKTNDLNTVSTKAIFIGIVLENYGNVTP
jgi:hypothetical protein